MSDPLKKTEPVEDKGAKQIAEMSPEELEKNKNRFLFRSGMIDQDPDASTEKKDDKVGEAPPGDQPPGDKKVEEKKDETPPAPAGKENKEGEQEEPPAKTPRRRQEPRQELTSEVIKEAVQAGATAAIEASKTSSTTKETRDEQQVDLDPKDKKTIEVIRFMEEGNRAPKGSADKTIEFWRKEDGYVSEWEKNNPDKEFNENDSEHQDFYARHEPKIDPNDFEQAKEDRIVSIAKKQAKDEAREEMAPEISKISFERQLEKLEPQIERLANQSVVKLIEAASPDLAKVLGEDGKRALAKDTFEKLDAEDPVAAEILQDESERLQLLMTEHELLTAFPDRYKPDMSHTIQLSSGVDVVPHRELTKIIRGVEADLSELPKAETDRDGKAFIPKSDLIERHNRIVEDKTLSDDRKKAAIRDLNERYWTLTKDDIRKALVNEHVDSAKRRIEKQTTIFDRKASKGKKPPEKSTQTEEAPPSKTLQELPSRGGSPSVSSSSDKVNNNGNGQKGSLSRDEIIEQKMGW